jgi:hypothetical protein
MRVSVLMTGLALVTGTVLSAETPAAPKEQPPRSQSGAAARPAGPAAPTAKSAEATPELLAWVDLCVKNLGSKDSNVQASAAAALRSAGTPALPALKKAAAGSDAKLAQTAKRVQSQIERGGSARGAEGDGSSGAAERYTSELALSQEQAAKFKAIFDDYTSKQIDLSQSVQSKELDSAAAGKQSAALRAEMDQKLTQVLSADQMKKFRELSPNPGARKATPQR